MRKTLPALLCLILILMLARPASAQTSASARLSAPDASAFPKVTAWLDVFDAQGQFITGLGAGDVSVLEDGAARTLDDLTAVEPGARLVVAINPGPPLSVRDSQGITRYERVTAALRMWAEARPADTADELSLVTIAGQQITAVKPVEWLTHLGAYQPDFNTAIPSLQSLAFAMDTSVANPKPGVKSAILYITPNFESRDIRTLEGLQLRLADNNVRVYVWLVDSESTFNSQTAVALKALALQTGGQFFAFSGSEAFPDPETYFASLRHAYTLAYTSAASAAGEHKVEVQVKAGTQALTTPEQTFSVDIQPPNPFLVAPPMQVMRQPPLDDPYNDEILIPTEQSLEAIIEFPDSHPRPIVRSALYVDNEIVAINESAPFDKFAWDLSAYTTSGIHELKVEAIDSLGLSKVSMGVPVTITVIQAPRGMAAFLARYRTIITASAIGLAGLLLAAILFWGRLLRVPSPKARQEARKRYADPLTQPVSIRPDRSAQVKRGNAILPWPHKPKVPQAPAYLIKLNAAGEPLATNPIALNAREMTFGADPVQSTYILDDPSISPLHARLRQDEEGVFLLSDQGSIAGTWINYEPLDREGLKLKHGDVIHFGQLVYRFSLHSTIEKEPSITPELPET